MKRVLKAIHEAEALDSEGVAARGLTGAQVEVVAVSTNLAGFKEKAQQAKRQTLHREERQSKIGSKCERSNKRRLTDYVLQLESYQFQASVDARRNFRINNGSALAHPSQLGGVRSINWDQNSKTYIAPIHFLPAKIQWMTHRIDLRDLYISSSTAWPRSQTVSTLRTGSWKGWGKTVSGVSLHDMMMLGLIATQSFLAMLL